MMKNVFERTEKKYILSSADYNYILDEVKKRMLPDKYANYEVCNIYFDTPSSQIIRTSVEKPFFKQKLRLRSYGLPKEDDNVFFELKMKYDGVVYKRRIIIQYSEFLEYLKTGELATNSRIAEEIKRYISKTNVKPFLFLAYNREAYYSKEDGDLRLTFDNNIRARYDNPYFEFGSDGEQVLGEGEYLMEIKVASSYPLWLAKLLSNAKVYPRSFSKYGTVYLKNQQNLPL